MVTRALLERVLQELLALEKLSRSALDGFGEKVSGDFLALVLREHAQATAIQRDRICAALKLLRLKERPGPAFVARGLVCEVQRRADDLELHGESLDFVIAAGMLQLEHYELVRYRSCLLLVEQLGLSDISHLVRATIREELNVRDDLDEIVPRLVRGLPSQNGSLEVGIEAHG